MAESQERVTPSSHRHPLRVYYEDTDFSGVVYHASYLRFLERGRTEWLRALGVDQRALHAAPDAPAFAVRRMSLEFRRPARMDDELTVETALAGVRGASVELRQAVLRGDEALVTAEVTVVLVAGGKPRRLPEALKFALGSCCP